MNRANAHSGPRIVYAGTPDFAVPPLQRLIDEGYTPVAVLTQPDRPAGRGRKLQASPVKSLALEHNIDVFQPESLKNAPATDLVRELEADLMIVVAYGLILPADILEIPAAGCWNIHASLLPSWRGAAPIQRAIEAGDRQSGVCIMQMDEGLDTGPVIKCAKLALDEHETGGSLHDKLAELGAEALIECVKRLSRGESPPASPQPEQGISYARKLNKAEASINWEQSAITLDRKIRAFNPWPVAWCMIGDERTRIWLAQALEESASNPPGTILSAGPQGIDIATGDGVLRLLELQRPGKRRMSAADYLNAASLPERLDP